MADGPTGDLAGMVALVTGAASGIGAATAIRMARAGADVAIVDVNSSGSVVTADAVTAMGRRVLVRTLDLADLHLIPGLVDDVVAELGRVDILVNCAAIMGSPVQRFLDVMMDVFDEVYAVNLKAPLVLMQCCAQVMIRQGDGGRIVNVTSSGVHRGRALPSYSSAKAALGQLTRVAAHELGPNFINVNSVAPGLTRTGLSSGADIDKMLTEIPHANQLIKRVSEPEDVAGVIAFLCSVEARQITGQTVHTSAGAIL